MKVDTFLITLISMIYLSTSTSAGSVWTLEKTIPNVDELAIGKDIKLEENVILAIDRATGSNYHHVSAYNKNGNLISNGTVPTFVKHICYESNHDWDTNEYVGPHYYGGFSYDYYQGQTTTDDHVGKGHHLQAGYGYTITNASACDRPIHCDNCFWGIAYQGDTYHFDEYGRGFYVNDVRYPLPNEPSEGYLAYVGDLDEDGKVDLVIHSKRNILIYEDPPSFDFMAWFIGLWNRVWSG